MRWQIDKKSVHSFHILWAQSVNVCLLFSYYYSLNSYSDGDFSREETNSAVLKFYEQVIILTYLEDSKLKRTPENGLYNIGSEALRARGKTDIEYTKLLVAYEIEPLCYIDQNASTMLMEDKNPHPAHRIYLTQGVDREGYSLILDSFNGNIISYSVSGYDIIKPNDEYENMPEKDKGKAHRTESITDFFRSWTLKYKHWSGC